MIGHKPYYGMGAFLVGDKIDMIVAFVFAVDEAAARNLMVEMLSRGGDIIPNSIKVVLGSTIPADWLMDSAMKSDEANWSSGKSYQPALPSDGEEYLS